MGLFSIFKSKEPLLPDYSLLQVDLHSHLIPGIDDGARDISESLALLEQFQEFGYKKVITTPHIMFDGYRNSPTNIMAGLEKIREAATEAGLTIEIDAAAEYMLDDGLLPKLESGDFLTINNKYFLFELSYLNAPATIENVVSKIKALGYSPLLAHPERYPYFYSSRLEAYSDLKEKGVYFQLNIPSLVGHYGPPAKEFAEKLIDHDMVEFLASDLHNERHIIVLKNALKEKYLLKLVESGRLLNNQLL